MHIFVLWVPSSIVSRGSNARFLTILQMCSLSTTLDANFCCMTTSKSIDLKWFPPIMTTWKNEKYSTTKSHFELKFPNFCPRIAPYIWSNYMQSKIHICLINLLYTHGRRCRYVWMRKGVLNISESPKHAFRQVMKFHHGSAFNSSRVSTYFLQWTSHVVVVIGRKSIILDLQMIQCIYVYICQ